TTQGIDCWVFVRVALTAAALVCPRDSDMQERALGAIAADTHRLRRGDLLFWNGHVAVARDAVSLLHANAFHMAVAIEPIAEAVRRIADGGSPLRTGKRVASLPGDKHGADVDS